MRQRVGLLILILAVGFSGHWVLFQWHEVVPGVIARPLGACDVQYHAQWNATVLACPHTDLIKVWPLPIVQPWYEDPFIDQQAASLRLSLRSQ